MDNESEYENKSRSGKKIGFNDNTNGLILGFGSAFIYTKFKFDIDTVGMFSFVTSLIGVALVPLVLSVIFSAFAKFKNFGKVFGITSLICFLIAGIGSRNRGDMEESALKQHSINNYYKRDIERFSDSLRFA